MAETIYRFKIDTPCGRVIQLCCHWLPAVASFGFAVIKLLTVALLALRALFILLRRMLFVRLKSSRYLLLMVALFGCAVIGSPKDHNVYY
jgi:hypothetical protein